MLNLSDMHQQTHATVAGVITLTSPHLAKNPRSCYIYDLAAWWNTPYSFTLLLLLHSNPLSNRNVYL